MRVAAYIAGDKNIVRSSIVVFTSLIKHEPKIDRYLFLSNLKIEKKDKLIIDKLNIKLMKIADNCFKSSLTWPRECFLNFKAPVILNKLGYDVALKFDNDVLINGKLDVKNNVPKSAIFSMINHNHERLKDMIIKDWDYFSHRYNLPDKNKKIGMFGNVYINLNKYNKLKFWDKYKETYQEILKESPGQSSDSFFADMGLFAIVLEKYGLQYETIDEKYNCCASTRHLKSYRKLEMHPRVIHYAGPKKPWKELGRRLFTNPYYAYLRQIWIDFVSENTEFNWDLKSRDKQVSLTEGKIIHSRFYKIFTRYFVKIKKFHCIPFAHYK